MNIEIANRLVELRKKNNLSQEALAEKLGISRQAVSKWERAEASPDTDNLIMLAKIYRVSLDDLLKTEEAASFAIETELAAEVSPGKSVCMIEEALDEPVRIIEDEPAKFDFRMLHHFPVYAVGIMAYVMLGAFWDLWHPGWLLFFLLPIWQSAIIAIEKKDARCFAYPVLTILVYLCMGLFGNLWHPGWVIFFTIPFYYFLVNYLRKMYQEQKKELDNILQKSK